MYLTDLTDAQKEYIKGTILMDNWRSKYDFFLILDAIIFIDVSGVQWRNLPHEYPKWQTVYYYFRRWGAMDAFSELEDVLVQEVRLKRGESPTPTIGAIDSQSSHSALPRSEKGIDGNKKVKGVKRNIITDKDGDILEGSTTPANMHDSKTAYALVALLVATFPWIKRIYADRGIVATSLKQPSMTSELILRLHILTTAVNLSLPRRDGLWSGLSRGWITSDGYAATMRKPLHPPMKCSWWQLWC